MRLVRQLALLCACTLLHLASAQADEEATVTTELIAEVRESVRDVNGNQEYRFAPATLLEQGQIVYYTVRIHNPTPVPIRDVTITQRVPANTTYVPGTASGPGAHVALSADGGQTFEPESNKVSTGEGRSGPRYTHVRWRLRNPLAPGATALARFQAVFD